MFIEYQEKIVSEDDTIQKLAVILGKLESKAIIKLVDEIELPKVLEKYLTKKEQDMYHRSKYKLKRLLVKEVDKDNARSLFKV